MPTLIDQGDYETTIAQALPTTGWRVLSYTSPILAVHASLLRTGKVFLFCGSGNDPARLTTPYQSVVWDTVQGTFVAQAAPKDSTGAPIDFFCAAHSYRPDGRMMVAGGSLEYDPFFGTPAARLFNPLTQKWDGLPSMKRGRWYPTVLTLGNGTILSVGGLDINGNLDRYPEIYSSTRGGWTAFSKPTSAIPLYAHLYQLKTTGKIFYPGAYYYNYKFPSGGGAPRILTLPTAFDQQITQQLVTGLADPSYGDQAASVFLPPVQDQKVMIIGGGNAAGMATKRVSIIDLNASTPTYKTAAPLKTARMHHNAILLPDRTVFVCNGSGMDSSVAQASLKAEIYNPATNVWTEVAAQTVPRVYHSVALLLADGSIATAGSNPVRRTVEMRLEIYRPAYMAQPRPIIQRTLPQEVSPSTGETLTSVGRGGTITVQTFQAASIKWVSLIKPMSTTHALDTDQRLVDAPIVSRTSTELKVTVPTNRNFAPPGWYMLFITNNDNVPSVASWVRLT